MKVGKVLSTIGDGSPGFSPDKNGTAEAVPFPKPTLKTQVLDKHLVLRDAHAVAARAPLLA